MLFFKTMDIADLECSVNRISMYNLKFVDILTF